MRKSTKNSRHTKKWYNKEAITYIHYTLQICHLHTTVSWVDIHSFKAKLLALASKYNIVLNHYCTEKKDSLKLWHNSNKHSCQIHEKLSSIMHKITMVKPGTPIHIPIYCVPEGYEWAEYKGGSIHELCHL